MSKHLYTEMMLRALDMALQQRHQEGVILHSDQGYTVRFQFPRAPMARVRPTSSTGTTRSTAAPNSSPGSCLTFSSGWPTRLSSSRGRMK
jgi:hypothetical protein